MAIYLPGAAEDQELALDELTPRQIVAVKLPCRRGTGTESTFYPGRPPR
jgi:hypothetical protein